MEYAKAIMITTQSIARKSARAWGAFEPDRAPHECPHQRALLGQKAEPCAAVGSHVEISRANVTLLYLHRLVANDDGGLEWLIAREGEVVRGVETCGPLPLKRQR